MCVWSAFDGIVEHEWVGLVGGKGDFTFFPNIFFVKSFTCYLFCFNMTKLRNKKVESDLNVYCLMKAYSMYLYSSIRYKLWVFHLILNCFIKHNIERKMFIACFYIKCSLQNEYQNGQEFITTNPSRKLLDRNR